MTTDPHDIASRWLSSFDGLCAAPAVGAAPDQDAFTSVFYPESWLRDLLALSWDFRTLNGLDAIKEYFTTDDRLRKVGLSNFRLDARTADRGATLQPLPDGGECIVLLFRFDIAAPAATGRGCARLLQQPDGSWKAWTTLVTLHDIVGHEENVGRAPAIVGQTWDEAWDDLNASIAQDLAVLIGERVAVVPQKCPHALQSEAATLVSSWPHV